MNIACFTCFIPRHENIKGPSGLLYQMLKWRPLDYKVTVFIFCQSSEEYRNIFEVKELFSMGIKFITVQSSTGRINTSRFWPLGARKIAQSSIPDLHGFDAVWAYPYWFAPFLRKCTIPVLISGMDCATLLYWRKLKKTPIIRPLRVLNVAAGFLANMLFEFKYLRKRPVHVVGQRDAKILSLLGARPTYIPHPLLAYPDVMPSASKRRHPLTILLSNLDDPIYGSTLYLKWIRQIFDCISDETDIHLIVHKASTNALRVITDVASNHPKVVIESLGWIDDYATLLLTVDIQIFPLEIGAGTKTSVLTALQHGVRAVCSQVAAENIQSNPLMYVVDDSAGSFSKELSRANTDYEAFNGISNVNNLSQHSPEFCGEKFWRFISHHVR